MGLATVGMSAARCAADEPPYNAMGERVGEVTDRSAIVHTRLTAAAERNYKGYKFPGARHGMNVTDLRKIPMPEGMAVADLEGDCPGKAGRAKLWYGTDSKLQGARSTAWASVDGHTDFTHRFVLDDLKPETTYHYAVELGAAAGKKTRRGLIGRFRTAPPRDQWRKTNFVVVTCQD